MELVGTGRDWRVGDLADAPLDAAVTVLSLSGLAKPSSAARR